MSIPTGNLIAEYDFLNPACYSGSGTAIYDLVITGFELTTDTTTAATYDSGQGTFSLAMGDPLGSPNPFIRSEIGNYVNTGIDDFTVNIWFNITSFSAKPPYSFLFLNGNRQGSYEGYGISVLGASNNLSIGVPGIADIDTGYSPSTNTWYMASLVVDSSSNYNFYINASSVDTGSFNTPNALTSNSQFAIGHPASTFNDEVYNGKSTYISFYNAALGNTDIQNIYDETVTRFDLPPEPPYVGIAGGRQFSQGFNG
jgi:hypothetical protein